MSLWRIYYHLVWATKQRFPLITPEIEDELYPYIIGKSDALGCIVHAIGGIEDHIHIVASIPPNLSVAEFVKNIKGSSTYHLNHAGSGSLTRFGWQDGYGVFSLGGKQMDIAVNYVKNQKIHHLKNDLKPSLERISDRDDRPSMWYENKR
ncbi:IS200/IS605 family transposase [Phormidium sp. CCY1219]|uniref:IS200/IS605 family transposase n=1 Tax=Phormidium sp. CCY1219 TaxID=2886104 RepID=UPI002D76A897|nr:IS200/IS605 family transposase [Phormidium sp. CCY1219]